MTVACTPRLAAFRGPRLVTKLLRSDGRLSRAHSTEIRELIAERPMQDVRSFTARLPPVRQTDGARSAIAISLLIVAAAGVTLVSSRRRHRSAERVLRDTGPSRRRPIVFAAGFVALCYVTLTFYDFFSLHTIGRGHVPYRIAALASFTSYRSGTYLARLCSPTPARLALAYHSASVVIDVSYVATDGILTG